MTTEFWAGVATIPAAIIALALAALIGRALLRLSAVFGAVALSITPDQDRHRRARFAALTYSARKAWVLVVSDRFAVAVFGTGEPVEQAKAYAALNPPVDIATLARKERP